MSQQNLIQKNPNTAGSIFLSVLTIIAMVLSLPIVWIITLAISSIQLKKAKEAKENRKFIISGYIFIALPIVLLLVNVIFFVISNLNTAGAL